MKLSKELEAKCLELAGVRPEPGTAFDATVPLPPSTNNLFVTRGKRRFKSPAYRAWLGRAVPVLKTLRPPRSLPAEILVSVFGKVHHGRDLDNMLKPIGDALVAAGVIPGDTFRVVREWRIGYGGDPDGFGEPVALVRVAAAKEV